MAPRLPQRGGPRSPSPEERGALGHHGPDSSRLPHPPKREPPPEAPLGVSVDVDLDASVTCYGEARWVPLTLLDGRKGWIHRGDIRPWEPLSLDALCAEAQRLLGCPYLWGGRSSMGCDCSGYVQMLYRMAGIILPRDACQQATSGEAVDTLLPGDLLFYGSAGQVGHVALFLGATASSTQHPHHPRVTLASLRSLNSDPGYGSLQTVRRLLAPR